MNHDIFFDIILGVFGILTLRPIVLDFFKKPRPKFKMPYAFMAGAAWGALAIDAYKENKLSLTIFVGLLGIAILYSLNKRDTEKVIPDSSTGGV